MKPTINMTWDSYKNMKPHFKFMYLECSWKVVRDNLYVIVELSTFYDKLHVRFSRVRLEHFYVTANKVWDISQGELPSEIIGAIKLLNEAMPEENAQPVTTDTISKIETYVNWLDLYVCDNRIEFHDDRRNDWKIIDEPDAPEFMQYHLERVEFWVQKRFQVVDRINGAVVQRQNPRIDEDGVGFDSPSAPPKDE